MSRSPNNPRVALLKRHYSALGIAQGWTYDQFSQLCVSANCKPEEMAAMCGVFTLNVIGTWKKRNRVPAPISLHLHMIRAVLSETKEVKEMSPIPIEMLEL